MKIYEVKYLFHGKPYSIRIEGANTIPDAFIAVESILNKVYGLKADIRGIFEVYI